MQQERQCYMAHEHKKTSMTSAGQRKISAKPVARHKALPITDTIDASTRFFDRFDAKLPTPPGNRWPEAAQPGTSYGREGWPETPRWTGSSTQPWRRR